MGGREAGGKMGRQPSGGFGGEEQMHSFPVHPHFSSASPIPSPQQFASGQAQTTRRRDRGLKDKRLGEARNFQQWLCPLLPPAMVPVPPDGPASGSVSLQPDGQCSLPSAAGLWASPFSCLTSYFFLHSHGPSSASCLYCL